MTNTNLTATQIEALGTLGASMKYRSATTLGIAPATLGQMVRLGLVEMKTRRIQSSNPRSRVSSEPIERTYRASMAGFNAHRKATR